MSVHATALRLWTEGRRMKTRIFPHKIQCVYVRDAHYYQKKKKQGENERAIFFITSDGFFYNNSWNACLSIQQIDFFFQCTPPNKYSWAWTCSSEIILIDSAFRRFTSSSFFYYNYINFICYAPNQFIIYLKSRRKKSREMATKHTTEYEELTIEPCGWEWDSTFDGCDFYRASIYLQKLCWCCFLSFFIIIFSFLFCCYSMRFLKFPFFAVAGFPSRCFHVNIFLFAMKSTTFTLGLTLGW